MLCPIPEVFLNIPKMGFGLPHRNREQNQIVLGQLAVLAAGLDSARMHQATGEKRHGMPGLFAHSTPAGRDAHNDTHGSPVALEESLE